VAVRSPSMVHGYLDDEAATTRHFRDGWFTPGDLAALIGERRFRLLRRGGDVLKFGGGKPAPQPLHAPLRRMPRARDAGVTSIPMGDAIDRLCVAIVVEAGADAQSVRAQVPAIAKGWPQLSIRAVPEVPRTANGKIIRAALRDLFRARG